MSFRSLCFVALVAFSAIARASPVEKRQLAQVYHSCNNPNEVALTFDDGPYIYEQTLADTLTNAGAKGTFFVNGNNWACIYDVGRADGLLYAYNQGHEIGSHTWSHLDLTTLTFDQVHDEMWRVELAMQKILGVSPALMRPPYGSYNDNVLNVAAMRNQSLVLWDFDSGDSTGATVAQSEQSYSNIANQRPSNILTLNHETYQTTVEQVLPYALKVLSAAGYSFVTVSQCLGVPAYKDSGTTYVPGTRDSSWVC